MPCGFFYAFTPKYHSCFTKSLKRKILLIVMTKVCYFYAAGLSK